MRDFPVIELQEDEYFMTSTKLRLLYYDIEVQLVPKDGSYCYPHLGQCSIHLNMRCDCHGTNWRDYQTIMM